MEPIEASGLELDQPAVEEGVKTYDGAAMAQYNKYALKNIPPTELTQNCHCLVYEYLLLNCHSETAAVLASSVNYDVSPKQPSLEVMDVDHEVSQPQMSVVGRLSRTGKVALATLDLRKRCRTMILKGDIVSACALIEEHLPELVRDIKNTLAACSSGEASSVVRSSGFVSILAVEMWFKLQCQQFIELVRNEDPSKLEFSREMLGKYVYYDSKYMRHLEDIIAVIAYKNPLDSPCAHLFQQERREKVASFVNTALIQHHLAQMVPKSLEPSDSTKSCELGTTMNGGIDSLVRQASAVRLLLNAEGLKKKKKDKVVYPLWSFTSFLHAQCIPKRPSAITGTSTTPQSNRTSNRAAPTDEGGASSADSIPASLQPQDSRGTFTQI